MATAPTRECGHARRTATRAQKRAARYRTHITERIADRHPVLPHVAMAKVRQSIDLAVEAYMNGYMDGADDQGDAEPGR